MSKLTFKSFQPDNHVGIVMLYGPAGAGKTTLASTALLKPELMGDVLFIDSDGGLGVLSSSYDNALVVDMHETADLIQILTELTLPKSRKRAELQNVGTLVIDSLSAFKDQALAEISEKGLAKGGKNREAFVNQLQDWNMVVNILRSFLYQIRQTDYKVIVTAGEKSVTDVAGVTTSITPNLNAQALNSTNYIMSAIWRVRALSTGDRAINIFPTNKVEINKTRANPEANAALHKITDDRGRLIVPNYIEHQQVAIIPMLWEILTNPNEYDKIVSSYNFK